MNIRMKRCICIIICGILFLFPEQVFARAANHVPGEILIKYKSTANIDAHRLSETQNGIKRIKTWDKIGVERLKLPTGLSVEAAMVMYGEDPDVAYAEPNYYIYGRKNPNDPDFQKQWGLENTGQSVSGNSGGASADISAVDAWDIATGSSDVVVAVIDTGVDYLHPDLKGNIWSNSKEIDGNGIDDDENGYVDDIMGWDFISDDNDPMDNNGHGTRIAGVIAAKGDNNTGIAGVAWQTKMMVLRALDANAVGTTADAIEAIQYANDNGAHIINCSWGGTEFSQFLKDAIEASSTLVVCAAGNQGSNSDENASFPTCFDSENLITVTASDQDDQLAVFSNYGGISVDVAAPGVNIFSSIPSREDVFSENFDENDISGWTTGGDQSLWGTTDPASKSGNYALTDSPDGDYVNDTNAWIQLPEIDLASHTGGRLTFEIKGQSQSGADVFTVEASKGDDDWTKIDMRIGNEFSSELSGTISDWLTATADLSAFDGERILFIRFLFSSDASTVNDGWVIDDVVISTATGSHTGNAYGFSEGTSFSAAHVSGVAALVKSKNPGMTATEIKSAIEDNVDYISSYGDKLSTGGRLNAAAALGANASGADTAPGKLKVDIIAETNVVLTWEDNSDDETGFEIERKADDETDFRQISVTDADITTYEDTELTNGVEYHYRVRAIFESSESGYSNIAVAITDDSSKEDINRPTDLAANVVSKTRIDLSWADNSTNETQFVIERKIKGAEFTELAQVDENVTEYQDSSLTADTTYVYRVKAENDDGESGYSGEVEVKTNGSGDGDDDDDGNCFIETIYHKIF